MAAGRGALDVRVGDDVRQLRGKGDHLVVRLGGRDGKFAEASGLEQILCPLQELNVVKDRGDEHHGRAVIEIASCVFEARVVRARHRVAAEIRKAVFLCQREQRLTNDTLRAAAVDDHGLCSNKGCHFSDIADRGLRINGDEDEIARADILLR